MRSRYSRYLHANPDTRPVCPIHGVHMARNQIEWYCPRSVTTYERDEGTTVTRPCEEKA